MRLWWTVGGCEIEAPIGESPGLHLRVDDAGRLTSTALDRPSQRPEEEPFGGLADRLEIDAALLRPELLDAVRTPKRHHIVLLNERGKATLDGALWPGSIPLDTKGAKSPTWPKKLLWKKKAPRSRTRKMSTERGQILLHAYGDAIAVTCRYTGIVAVFRGGSMTPSLLRMPLEPGLRLRASATARGVLVAASKASGRGAIVHYADDGAVLGKREFTGLLRALPTSESRALVLTQGDDGDGSARLHLIDLGAHPLPDLPRPAEDQRSASVELGFAATALAVADDGRFAATDGLTLRRGRIDGDTLALGDPLDLRGESMTPGAAADDEQTAPDASPSAHAPAPKADDTSAEPDPPPCAEPEPDGGTEANPDAGAGVDADATADATAEPTAEPTADPTADVAADIDADELTVKDDASPHASATPPAESGGDADASPTSVHPPDADVPRPEDAAPHTSSDAPRPEAQADASADPKPATDAPVDAPAPDPDPSTDAPAVATDEDAEAGHIADPAPDPDSDSSPNSDPDRPHGDAPPAARREGHAAEEAAPTLAPLLDGPPALGLGIGGPPAPGWGGEAPRPFTITLRLRSTGRAAEGLEIEVGGEALTRGLVQLIEVVADDHSGAFLPSEAGMRRATLPGLAIPPGVDLDVDAPTSRALADSHVEVTIRAQAIRRGSGLLALRVGVLGSPAAKLRRLRPVTIR